jgi:hypothetical protein
MDKNRIYLRPQKILMANENWRDHGLDGNTKCRNMYNSELEESGCRHKSEHWKELGQRMTHTR